LAINPFNSEKGFFMNILLIGQGGREHALAWKIAQSNTLQSLHLLPGSDAMEALTPHHAEAKVIRHAEMDVTDHAQIKQLCTQRGIDLVIIGPEAPLVDGLADALRAAEILVFGPSKAAAQLEGSKGFMKDLCAKYDIPTAHYQRFEYTQKQAAKDYIDMHGAPIVLKADGLAAGKGVIVAQDKAEALDAVDKLLSEQGAEIVIEEFLDGEEVSFFALSDGQHVIPLTSAQDHKAAYDGDKGPNTGGMGAYSPAPKVLFDQEMQNRVITRIIEPTAAAMRSEGIPFQGVFFAGLMMVRDDEGQIQPKLLEYNIRFGDPECQVIMMRLESDLVPVLKACAEGKLQEHFDHSPLQWHDDHAVCVIMAADGYPGSYQKGSIMTLPEHIADHQIIFHAGTKHHQSGTWQSNGGRVLCCCARGQTLQKAQGSAYQLVKNIEWDGGFYRNDIGWRGVLREQKHHNAIPAA
jgi:phosphoribosylamine--glycine ligase